MWTLTRFHHFIIVLGFLFFLLEPTSAQAAGGNGLDRFCANDNDVINGTSTTWSALAEEGILSLSESYLRPDEQALLPWIYTVIVFIFHLPTVIIRVVRWENIQLLCLIVTFSTNVIYTLAYVSTKFEPENILVWTPIMLVIDCGSMSQVLFLVNEGRLVWLRFCCQIGRMETDDALSRARNEENLRFEKQGVDPLSDEQLRELVNQPLWKDTRVAVAVTAALFLLHVLVLQILGLYHACKGSQASEPPKVRWCSPIFQPFGLVVRDGECNLYEIDQSFRKGIGCIALPGIWQQRWLRGTVIGTAFSIACEVTDILILSIVASDWKPLGVKMRRPWFTMFTGIAVLLVTLVFGKLYADDLPPGITHKVWLVSKSVTPKLYSAQLESAGLRGAIIGWSDGLFHSWRFDYFGPSQY
ncbi:hypothetical protein EPUS_08153 [Endocarpon pusillum Z07020]|uniref:Solute carrier family 40 protein n=1 Tax=Endocarpon pusillum (strain Z07020 / HMAS-L-300199) TaxID=1263415 RepID=U1HLT6_ENDPU|nr:uncharacterized protein EPUS_08153 [Endocarpon pusillum Z07020]ERF71235.1 hypothetical protein EPUS_08153 [Endocarpon pusillum Z07020]